MFIPSDTGVWTITKRTFLHQIHKSANLVFLEDWSKWGCDTSSDWMLSLLFRVIRVESLNGSLMISVNYLRRTEGCCCSQSPSIQILWRSSTVHVKSAWLNRLFFLFPNFKPIIIDCSSAACDDWLVFPFLLMVVVKLLCVWEQGLPVSGKAEVNRRSALLSSMKASCNCQAVQCSSSSHKTNHLSKIPDLQLGGF